MDKRLITVILAAVLMALLITAIFYQVTVGRGPSQAVVPTREVVIAKSDLPIGAVIGNADVMVKDYAEQDYPKNGFSNIEEVIERSVQKPILANEPILMGRVTDKGVGFGLAPLIPEGMRAMAISVNQVSGVSGFILPGSDVDILLTGSPPGSKGRVTTTVLEKVRVLSTGQQTESIDGRDSQVVPVVNVLVTPEQAELLTLATREGTIQLILRNPIDHEETASDRLAVRASDLFTKARRQRQPAGRPRPRPRVVAQPPPPPPPPAPQVEMIRGNRRTVETLAGSTN